MLRECSCAMLLVLYSNANVHAATSAPVTAVTIYSGVATVERTAELVSGARDVTIEALPANFDVQTLHVEADSGIQIGQIQVKDNQTLNWVNPQAQVLADEIAALQDQIESLQGEIRASELGLNYLKSLQGTNEKKPKVDTDLVTLLKHIETSARATEKRMQEVKIKQRPLQIALQEKQRELDVIRNGTRALRSINLKVAAKAGGKIRLSYQVPRAGWQPTYRAELNTQVGKVTIERLALISQKTDEDWNNVKLTLSTGQPQSYRPPLDPQTHLIEFKKILPEELVRSSTKMAARMAAEPSSYEMEKMSVAEDDYIAPVIKADGNFATEFEIPARVSLAADGRETAVSISQHTLDAKYHVQVVPASSREGDLIAEFARQEGVWLPGQVQIFRDGNYVGATHWVIANQVQEKLSLSFGNDELLQVDTERKVIKENNEGLMNARTLRETEDSYTVINRHKMPIDVHVLESTPIAKQEGDIKIEKAINPKPNQENWRDRTGVMAWEKRLNAGESLKITLNYKISYPKEGTVYGLP